MGTTGTHDAAVDTTSAVTVFRAERAEVLHAAGAWNLPVVPWTVDEPDDLERIIDDFDPDGINADRRDLSVSYVEEPEGY